VRLGPHASGPGEGLRPGETAPYLGLDAFRDWREGLLAKYGGGPSSAVEGRVCPGLGEVPLRLGRPLLPLVRRPGMTLFLRPSPVRVLPCPSCLIGRWIALPSFKNLTSDSISLRSGVKFASQIDATSSGSSGGSGYPCSREYWLSTVYRLPIRLFCRTIWFARRSGRMEKVAALSLGSCIRSDSSAYSYSVDARAMSA
jgi:hypothetical protein